MCCPLLLFHGPSPSPPHPILFPPTLQPTSLKPRSVWVISPFQDKTPVSLPMVLSLTSSSSSSHVPNRSPIIPQLSMPCPIKLNPMFPKTSSNRLTNRDQDQGQGQSPSSCHKGPLEHRCPLWAPEAASGSCRALCFSPTPWNFLPDSSSTATHDGS